MIVLSAENAQRQEELEALGLRTFASGNESGAAGETEEMPETITSIPAKVGPSLVTVGQGLPALSKKVVEKILSGVYMDFAELPPAKGRGRAAPQLAEGQIVVVQASDMIPNRKAIPDLATWLQCFSLYVTVIASHQPKRVPDLMAYQSLIAKASHTYRWPSWLVYDQSFRQEAAGKPTLTWAKVDPSIYALCFFGQNRSMENWCAECQAIDHTTTMYPTRLGRKRGWTAGGASGWTAGGAPGWTAGGAPQQVSRSADVCLKFNRFNGDCKFGRSCRFLHVCSGCGERHPISKCPRGGDKRARLDSEKPR